jgi:hypothetical protein
MGSDNDEHLFTSSKALISSNSFKRKGLPTDDKESLIKKAINSSDIAPSLWFNSSTIFIIYLPFQNCFPIAKHLR